MPPVRKTFRTRLQAWFAIAILALGMVAPSISAAVSQARCGDQLWLEICSSTGTRRVSTDSDQQNAALDMLMTGHCAMCHVQAHVIALPPHEPKVQLLQDLYFAMPERFFSAPVTAHAWRAAPARGPPVIV